MVRVLCQAGNSTVSLGAIKPSSAAFFVTTKAGQKWDNFCSKLVMVGTAVGTRLFFTPFTRMLQDIWSIINLVTCRKGQGQSLKGHLFR